MTGKRSGQPNVNGAGKRRKAARDAPKRPALPALALRARNGKRRKAGKGDEREERGRQRADGFAAKQVAQAQKRANQQQDVLADENGARGSGTSETGGGNATIGGTQCGDGDVELGGNNNRITESSSAGGVRRVGGDKENCGRPAVNGVGHTVDSGEYGGGVDKTGGEGPSSGSNTDVDDIRCSHPGVVTTPSDQDSDEDDDDQSGDDQSGDENGRSPSRDGDSEGGGGGRDETITLEATIRKLTRQLEESKKREPASALSSGNFSLVDLSGVRATNRRDGGNRESGQEELDVSSLGTVLTAGAAGLLKDVEFTSFVKRKAFWYAKYWVPARDAPVDSALANYFKSNWYGDYVQRNLGRHPCFDDWWIHNGMYIRQRLNQKRTNNIGQLRKICKGMFF